MSKFQPGNTASKGHGRPKGTGFVSRLRQVLADDPDKFESMVKNLLDAAESGDWQAASLILARTCPPLKPLAGAEPLELPEGPPVVQARAVIRLVADGKVAISDAKTLLDSILAVAQLEGMSALEARIAALEMARG